jgi:ABC-2 type transport system permease protein
MDLWRLERARLVRTNRLTILLGTYAFFGLLGPVTARYLNEILARFGGDVQVTLPDPTPADGIAQFIGNASQLGLLAVVVVAAAALAFDARPEVSVFLRTRVRSAASLVVPRVVTVAAAAVGALVVGTALAAALTVVLLGALDWAGLVVGTLYGALYLAFAVAVTAAMATVTASVLTTVFATVAVLIALPVLALIEPIARWLPSALVGAVDALVRGGAASDYLPAAAVTAVATAILTAVAISRAAAREL